MVKASAALFRTAKGAGRSNGRVEPPRDVCPRSAEARGRTSVSQSRPENLSAGVDECGASREAGNRPLPVTTSAPQRACVSRDSARSPRPSHTSRPRKAWRTASDRGCHWGRKRCSETMRREGSASAVDRCRWDGCPRLRCGRRFPDASRCSMNGWHPTPLRPATSAGDRNLQVGLRFPKFRKPAGRWPRRRLRPARKRTNQWIVGS